MNIEHSRRVPERQLTEAHLAKRLYDFSNVLANGRWPYDTYMVETTQCVIEQLGDEDESDLGPIYNEVTVSFSAARQTLEEDGEMIIVPHYSLTSTISQEIEKAEIPTHVLDAIFKEATEDQESLAYEVLEDAGFSDLLENGTGFGVGDDSDNLDQFEIKRIQELEYSIDHEGKVEDYTVSYAYSFDDVIVHNAVYQLSNSKVLTRPVYGVGGEVIDQQPIYVPHLDADALTGHLATLDTRVETFFTEEALRILETEVDIPQKEHVRRALGMLGVVSSGYAPRHWYNKVHDYLLHRWERKP